MEPKRTIGLAILILVVASVSARGWDDQVVARFGTPGAGVGVGDAGGRAPLAPCVSANFGCIIGDLWFPGIYTIGLCLYTGYYPGSAENQQVFQSAPWMGGYAEGAEGGDVWTAIGTFDQADFLSYDTICSGFKVAQPGGSGINIESTFDTGDSPKDLGVVTTLRYTMWSDPRYDDFVLVKADLKFTKSIRHFWWGWMSDCDVGNNTLTDYYYDDLVGYDEALGVAYMYDDDGDPAVPSDPRSKLLSPTHVGQTLLSAPPPGGSITEPATASATWETFTWWDWNNDVTGDASAYERLSQGTIKPNPPDQAFDYRMLTAVGPYEIQAGDSATFYLAIVFGDGLDADYWARRARIGASLSTMGSLMEHVENARDLFASSLVIEDPAPEPCVLADPLASGKEVTVGWECPSEEDDDFAGYRLYKSTVSNVGPWSLIRDFNDRPYPNSTVDTLKVGFPTFYLATAYDLAGTESTAGAASAKTLEGVYASTLPSDYSGDCEEACSEECQGCPECMEACVRNCMKQQARRALDGVFVAPNPYRGSGDWERLDYEGRLAFMNLPKQCTIYIYSLTGEMVDALQHNLPGDQSPDAAGNETGGESWDMLTADNQSIASGVYLYRVVSKEYGEKLGKFAVVRGDR
ncbi:MAG: hypothetical protein WAW06_10180 [bacterium]